MFRILVLDRRESIQSAIKYLLYRYELVFSSDVTDAVLKLSENSIDMFLVNLPLGNGSQSKIDMLKEWIEKKKTIVISDSAAPGIPEAVSKLGALDCIDKLDIGRLPELVDKYLNKSKTRIMSLQ